MTLLVPNVGENIALSYLIGKTTTVRNLYYGLFATNITPAETDTAGTYTEANGGGYTAGSSGKTLTGASWTVTNGAPTDASNSPQTWTFTGALTTNPTVYGYYVTRVTDADLVLSETFANFTPANNGDQIILTPHITCD